VEPAERTEVEWRRWICTPGAPVAFSHTRCYAESVLLLSHEALLLEYEESLTRPYDEAGSSGSNSRHTSPPSTPSARKNGYAQSPIRPTRLASAPSTFEGTGTEMTRGDSEDGSKTKKYNVSSHFVWIGDRTRQLDGAHVEYFRGIANPMYAFSGYLGLSLTVTTLDK